MVEDGQFGLIWIHRVAIEVRTGTPFCVARGTYDLNGSILRPLEGVYRITECGMTVDLLCGSFCRSRGDKDFDLLFFCFLGFCPEYFFQRNS